MVITSNASSLEGEGHMQKRRGLPFSKYSSVHSRIKAATCFHFPKSSPHCALTSKMDLVCGMSPESLLRTTLVVEPSTFISS